MVLALILHAIFFVTSLAFVGFVSMIEDLLLAMMAFSAFLTLYDWVISFYLIVLIMTCVHGIVTIFKYRDESFLFYVIDLIMYGLIIYKLGVTYYEYEMFGGNVK